MTKLTILLDMDSIVADFLGAWLKAVNDRYHRNLTINDITSWNLDELAKTKDLGGKVYKVFQKPMFFYDLEPLPGAINAVNALVQEGHDVYFLTKPASIHSAHEKLLWTDKFFPKVGWQKVIPTKYKHMVKGDVLVDDSGDNLEMYKKTHPEALVMGFRYPYNAYLENNELGIVLTGHWSDTDVAWGNALYEIRKLASSTVPGRPLNCS